MSHYYKYFLTRGRALSQIQLSLDVPYDTYLPSSFCNSSSIQMSLGVKNAASHNFFVSGIKKNFNTTVNDVKASTQTSNLIKNSLDGILWDAENRPSSVLQSSKKIQKINKNDNSSPRSALKDISNRTPSTPSSIKSQKSFLEDDVKKTKNYVTLTYYNTTKSEKHDFYCFHDQDLKVPAKFADKTITYTCDNDCVTDDEQVKGAIKILFKSLQETSRLG